MYATLFFYPCDWLLVGDQDMMYWAISRFLVVAYGVLYFDVKKNQQNASSHVY